VDKSFGAVFSDIRRRRRITLRAFTEFAGVSPSYIHDLERGGVLPSLDKLEAITSVLRQVAEEQGAADPEADTRELFRAREWTIYIERLGIDPRLAQIFIALRELDDDSLKTIEKPILDAIAFFRDELDQPLQRAIARALEEAIGILNGLNHGERMKLAEQVTEVLDSNKARSEPVTIETLFGSADAPSSVSKVDLPSTTGRHRPGE
jgi:transcriptional regulator with XRE-family HTH domain